VACAAVFLHILMDLPTSYGTRLFSPFDWSWFAVDWMPIVDAYLIVIFAVCLLFGRGSESARRRNVAIALALMAADYSLRGAAHHEAIAQAPRLFGPTLPAPCPGSAPAGLVDRWPGGNPESAADGRRSSTRCLVEVAAVPTLVSPFLWRVIAETSDAYEVHEIDLLDPRFRNPASGPDAMWRLSIRYPNIWTTEVFEAAGTSLGRIFLGFSRFPAARSFVDGGGNATIRWTDMRFVGGPLSLNQALRQGNLFTVVIRLGADGKVFQERFGP
jgi:hypothetical protein